VAQAVEAALIAGSASIAVGLITAFASARQGRRTRKLQGELAERQEKLQRELAERQESFDKALAELKGDLERQAKAEQKALDAQEALELFRAPLQHAAEDLGHRINNIRNLGFLVYVKDENPRRETAVLGTAYRFARFFATLEMLYDRAEFLRLERRSGGHAQQESAVDMLQEIGRTFASDRYDRTDKHDCFSSRFMIWREEQRAMGELARDRDRDAIVGFATFAARATGPDATWFEKFTADLKAGGADNSQRLEQIHALLARLVRSLDPPGSYLVEDKDGKKKEPDWMRQVASASRGNRGGAQT
jgi:hypothetical protein